ncbi:MAG: DUF2339 domain-containing protein, partial [Flammeovirgaceae bacterium]|nr:DUF2339 domain-containing protein [Flammeovirgaceae bacterium]MDW8287345.1 DUF2339 domain-containing protein [Flammeovirgaceae bacterium]
MSSTPPSSDDEMLQKELSEKRKRIEDIKQEIWEMKLEMSRLRKDILSQELSYKRLKDDPEYKQLLTLIGKTENWDDGWKDPENNYTVEPYKPSRKFFLSPKEADELRKKDPTFRKDNNDESWKKIPQKVFIKEFDKPKEVLEAELRQLKGIAEEEERQAAQKRQKQFLLMNEGVKRFKKLGDDLKKEVNKLKDIQRELPSKGDLSKYFGENLPSKIASLVVIVALIMLFRYGVEHGYISPWMRLLTGITIGTGFFILSHYLIHKKVNLTTILNMCGGLVFYYTIYLAYGPYQYIPQLTAFGLTLIVTIASIALAYYYDRKGLALSTLLGGYTVPMLLLEENDHYAWFFFYIFLLNAVMMVVGYLKKWRIVNVIGTLTTAFLLFVEFLGTDLTENDRLFWIIVLATAFYWIFYLANVVFTIREDVSFKTIDGFLLIFITGLYVYKMLKFLPLTGQESLIGIFFASIMLFNLAAVWILYGNRMADEPLIRLLIAKVIFSGSLSAFYFLPNIYFNAFLAFWAVTLFYMANLFKVSMLKDFSTYLMLAAFASLSYLWKNTYFGLLDNTQLFVNEAFLGSVFTFSAAAILFFWVLDEKDLPQLAFFSRDY